MTFEMEESVAEPSATDPKLLPQDQSVWNGTANSISWKAVEDVLRIAGEVLPGERVVAFRADEGTLMFFTEINPET